MRKKLLLLLSFVTLLLFTEIEVFGCRCLEKETETLKQRVTRFRRNADVVFSGKVVEVIETQTNIQISIAKIKVENIWKGSLSNEISIIDYRTSCSYEFELGKIYLVFANASTDGSFRTHVCNGNKEYQEAAKELKILGKGNPSQKNKSKHPTNLKNAPFRDT